MRANKNSIFWLIYRTTLVSLLFVAVISLFVNYTSSWFRDISITSNVPTSMVIGTIELEPTINVNFENLTLAPDTIYTSDDNNQTIHTEIKVSGDNNIQDVFVRVKFITNRPELTLYFGAQRRLPYDTSAYSASCNNKDSVGLAQSIFVSMSSI